ncbi:MAG: ATP-binding cassette domain-containing protein [Acidobacteria bacterium]|nr:MAG: ATP-binding cassette domain-containing protein [Acidobacteriota bacterium]
MADPSTSPAVVVEDLSRRFGERLALQSVDFAVGPGEVFALLGPNGGGKTTLFRILATLLPPSSGAFRVLGLDPGRDRREVRRLLGVVFQSPALDRSLTVRENLDFQGALFGMPRSLSRERGEGLLSRLGLLERAGERVATLSGGLARRVEIAKALLPRPPVLLLDEPSTGLDPLARRELRRLLSDLVRENGTTVLLTTHLFEEADAADRIGILDRGRLVATGAPADLKAAVGGDVVTVATGGPEEAAALAREVVARFGDSAGAVSPLGATVRVERPDGHAFVPPLVQAFPGRFASVTLSAPSLEDVFVDCTGHAFDEEAA